MAYNKQTWKNLPDQTTPLSAARLNHLETQYDEAVSYTDQKLADLTPGETAVVTVNGKFGPEVTLNHSDVGATTESFVNTSIETATGDLATTDELVFSMFATSWYSGTSAIVEFTNMQAITLMIAPFDMEISSVVLSFERYNLPRHATNIMRAKIQRVRNGDSTDFTNYKTTTTGSGGEAVSARRPWSVTAGGMLENKLLKNDLLQLVIGAEGSPPPILFPFTITIHYKPV